MIRLLLLVLGLAALVGIVWHVGLPRILEALGSLGPLALIFILTPSLVMYLLEAYGWRLTLGDHQRTVSFGRLLAIRTAGEVVNMTTPSAYVGGEPLKAYLLLRYRVPLVDGLASVIIAKTIMTIAQVLFILLGIALAFWILGESASSKQLGLAAIASIGLLVFGAAAFLVVQSRGLFVGLLGVLRALRIRIGFLERRESTLRELDESILQFYSRNRSAFLVSLGVFFLAWLAEAIEVYVILLALGVPADLLTSISVMVWGSSSAKGSVLRMRQDRREAVGCARYPSAAPRRGGKRQGYQRSSNAAQRVAGSGPSRITWPSVPRKSSRARIVTAVPVR